MPKPSGLHSVYTVGQNHLCMVSLCRRGDLQRALLLGLGPGLLSKHFRLGPPSFLAFIITSRFFPPPKSKSTLLLTK